MLNDVKLIRTNWCGDHLSGRVDAATIHRLVVRMQSRMGENELAVLVMSEADPAINWASFPAPSCALPGAAIGQLADFRFTLTNGAGLHLQRFRSARGSVVAAHFDKRDGCSRPIEHAADQTRAVEFAVFGGLVLGGLTFLATRNAKAALAAGAAGAGGGAYAGANTPTQRRVYFDLATVLAESGWWRP